MKKIFLFALVIILSLSLFGCGKSEEKKEVTLKVDFEKVIADTKKALTNKEHFPYVNDVHFEVDKEQKRIVLMASVSSAVRPEIALEFADTMIRRFGLNAQIQDGSLEPASKDYYGGLYDIYSVWVGVAPVGQENNPDKWFVDKITQPGNHTKQAPELQKPYRK